MIREFARPYIMTDKTGKVYNIEMHISYEGANRFARSIYGEGAGADEYNVLEDGTLSAAEYIPSEEEKINVLQLANDMLDEQLTETQMALAEQYEVNLALNEEVTNTQLALTELYELKEA